MITFLACLVDHEFVLTSLARLGLFYAYVRILIFMINGLFGSLEMEESRGEGSSGEESKEELFSFTLFGCL